MSFDAADVWVRTNLWALSTDGKNQVSLSRDAQVRAVRKLMAELEELRGIVEHVRGSPTGRLMISQMGQEPRYEQPTS